MRFLPAGPSALLVELEDGDAVLSLVSEIGRRWASDQPRRVVDVVPGASTVLLDGIEDPSAIAVELAGWHLEPPTPAAAPIVEVPCRYAGPDLGSVAAHWGLSEERVAEIHAGLDHRVAFTGFSPGFAYIAGLGDRWAVPRLETPRPLVEAGSVAVAGPFTGIYPRRTPGGWRIIGHTDLVLWDTAKDPPALLAPGMSVRFVIA
jgi:KipI family sensor histidine kinase inhibitor